MLTEATTSTTTTTIATLGIATTTLPRPPTPPAAPMDEQMDQSPSVRQMDECKRGDGRIMVVGKMKQIQVLSIPLLFAQTSAQGFQRDLSRSD